MLLASSLLLPFVLGFGGLYYLVDIYYVLLFTFMWIQYLHFIFDFCHKIWPLVKYAPICPILKKLVTALYKGDVCGLPLFMCPNFMYGLSHLATYYIYTVVAIWLDTSVWGTFYLSFPAWSIFHSSFNSQLLLDAL